MWLVSIFHHCWSQTKGLCFVPLDAWARLAPVWYANNNNDNMAAWILTAACLCFHLRFLGWAAFQREWVSGDMSPRRPGGADLHVQPRGRRGGANVAGSTTRVRQKQLKRKLPLQQVEKRKNVFPPFVAKCYLCGQSLKLVLFFLNSPLRSQTPLLVWRGSEGNSSQVNTTNILTH